MTGKVKSSRGWAGRYPWAFVLGVSGLTLAAATAATLSGTPALVATTAVVAQAPVNAAHVVGHVKCAECHKAEAAAWLKSPHGSQSFQLLSSAKAPDYAKAMGVTGSLSTSLCADCHATKTATAVVQGVSCESCHGAAGPADSGWLALHGDFGNAEKDRKTETKLHHAGRIAACKKLGMNRSADVYEIAKNCLSCHTVPNEKLVNAGHPTSSKFELVEWAQGSVRHNFQLDQTTNAEAPSLWLDPLHNGAGRTPAGRKKLMYVVGQLVDLEISLTSRAKASDSDFGAAAGRRISTAQRKLAKLDHIPEVKQALTAIAAIDRKALRTFRAGDAKLYAAAAAKVAAAAKALAAGHDGGKLGDVDVPTDAVGDVFKP